MSKLAASPDVLGAIRKQKRLLRKDIAASQTLIADSARALMAPAVCVGRKGHTVSQMVSRGMAIFEGVRIGLRLVRAARSLFRHGKRK